jgi:hypothetical protein
VAEFVSAPSGREGIRTEDEDELGGGIDRCVQVVAYPGGGRHLGEVAIVREAHLLEVFNELGDERSVLAGV